MFPHYFNPRDKGGWILQGALFWLFLAFSHGNALSLAQSDGAPQPTHKHEYQDTTKPLELHYSSPVSSSFKAERKRKTYAESTLSTYSSTYREHQYSSTSLSLLLTHLAQQGFPEASIELDEQGLHFDAGALGLRHPCLVTDEPQNECQSATYSLSASSLENTLSRQPSIRSFSLDGWSKIIEGPDHRFILPNVDIQDQRRPTIQGVVALQQEARDVALYGSMEIDAPYLGSHQRAFRGRYESTPNGVTLASLKLSQLWFKPWVQEHQVQVDFETRDTLSQTASVQWSSLWFAERSFRLGSQLGFSKSESTQATDQAIPENWQITAGLRANYGPWSFMRAPDRTMPEGWSWALETVTPLGSNPQRGSRITLRQLWSTHNDSWYGWIQLYQSYGWGVRMDDIQGWVSWGGEGMFRGLEAHQVQVRSAHSLSIDARHPVQSNLVIGALLDASYVPSSHYRPNVLANELSSFMGATGLVVELPSRGTTKMVLSVVFRVDQPLSQGLLRVRLQRNDR